MILLWVVWGAMIGVAQDLDEVDRPDPQPAMLELALPGRTWALTGRIAGIVLSPARETATGVTIRGTNIDNGLVLNASVFDAPEPGDAAHCRDVLWERDRPLETRDVVVTELGPWALVEYDVPKSHGAPIDRHDLMACRVHEEAWIHVRLSVPTFEDEDRESLRAPLAALAIGPVGP